MYDISNLKNETINIEMNISSYRVDNIKETISVLIFYSDFNNHFILNPLTNYYLPIYLIEWYICIQILLKI